MAVETLAITCVAGSYTRVAEDKTNCSVQLRTNGAGRIVVAASQPSASTADYIEITNEAPIDIGSMSGSEDVWFMPLGENSMTVAVIRG